MNPVPMLVYSYVPVPSQYYYFTFSAGPNLGLTWKDITKYVYINGDPATVWIQTEGADKAAGDPVLTGDPIAIKGMTPAANWLDFKSEYNAYAHWALAGVGSNAWQIFIDDAHTTGLQIPVGTPFTIWNATLNAALVPADTDFATVGSGTPWTFTATYDSQS